MNTNNMSRKVDLSIQIRQIVAAFVAGLAMGMVLLAAQREREPRIDADHAPRSGSWRTVRSRHLQAQPTCVICGSDQNLEVHHIQPFATHPERELDPTNLITMCANPSCRSHLTIGHLGRYTRSNPKVQEDASLLKKRRLECAEDR